jgi:hypothetical protein
MTLLISQAPDLDLSIIKSQGRKAENNKISCVSLYINYVSKNMLEITVTKLFFR